MYFWRHFTTVIALCAFSLCLPGCAGKASISTSSAGKNPDSIRTVSSSSASSPTEASVSPKPGWSEFPLIEEPAPRSGFEQALLWIPNRIFDFWDIFRVDVGAGPAVGGVIRVTEYAQAGMRTMAPGSLRVGAMGRQAPIMFETSNEVGVSPAFKQSQDRSICPGETGVGLDLLIIGLYLGVCWDEAADFVGGVFLLDFKDDDFE